MRPCLSAVKLQVCACHSSTFLRVFARTYLIIFICQFQADELTREDFKGAKVSHSNIHGLI